MDRVAGCWVGAGTRRRRHRCRAAHRPTAKVIQHGIAGIQMKETDVTAAGIIRPTRNALCAKQRAVLIDFHLTVRLGADAEDISVRIRGGDRRPLLHPALTGAVRPYLDPTARRVVYNGDLGRINGMIALCFEFEGNLIRIQVDVRQRNVRFLIDTKKGGYPINIPTGVHIQLIACNGIPRVCTAPIVPDNAIRPVERIQNSGGWEAGIIQIQAEQRSLTRS